MRSRPRLGLRGSPLGCGRARDRTVEVDDVDDLCALAFESARSRRRVLAVNGHAVHLSAQQAHDFTALQVD